MSLNKIRLSTLIGALILFTPFASAKETHYLPLKTDPLFELELEKLATVAKVPSLAKPYHISTIKQYLKTIANTHPTLYQRINNYLSRYSGTSELTQFSLEASYSDFDDKNLANARGRTTGSNIKAHIAGFWDIDDNLSLSLGGTIFDTHGDEDGVVPHNTYLSYTSDYFQLDLGYKEIWLSPLQESAMLLSTQAKPVARFSLSSPKPLTDWNLRYDLSFGKLEEMQGIRLGEERFSGRPGFLTMHFSGQPVDWWTIGVSRTMMFGGGPREIDAGDVWDAIIDPVSGDNCGGESSLQDCTLEAGNQQASVSTKFDLDWGIPLSIYMEVAGEDTAGFRKYSLGNRAYNLGLFLPYLNERSSASIEYQSFRVAWYIHSIYAEGYRNNLNTLGHWWGDEKAIDDGIGAQILSLRYNYELSKNYHFEVLYKTVNNDSRGQPRFEQYDYVRGHELNLRLDDVSSKHNLSYSLYIGNDVNDEDFARVGFEYRWK